MFPDFGLGFQFGSRKYLPLRNARLEEFRKRFEELELIILDEFSMIGSDHLYDIQRRLEEILVSKDIFAGRAIMLVGDILQLPPVKGRPVFSKPYSEKNRSLYNSDQNLWNNLETVTLKVNFRQGVSLWTEVLNRMRIGEITKEDEKLLEGRRVSNFPNLNTDEACHVMFTNQSSSIRQNI